MSKRLSEAEFRLKFYKEIEAGELNLSQALKKMRKIARMTQPEFAAFVGVSLPVLRGIEQEHGNPTVETLEKLGRPFGLEVGFVRRRES